MFVVIIHNSQSTKIQASSINRRMKKKYDTYTGQKHFSAIKTSEVGLGYSSVAEYLPSVGEVSGSIPSAITSASSTK